MIVRELIELLTYDPMLLDCGVTFVHRGEEYYLTPGDLRFRPPLEFIENLEGDNE